MLTKHKKSLHICEGFDTCERSRPNLKPIYPKIGGVVLVERGNEFVGEPHKLKYLA